MQASYRAICAEMRLAQSAAIGALADGAARCALLPRAAANAGRAGAGLARVSTMGLLSQSDNLPGRRGAVRD
jgi:hypothetical protein